VYRIIANISPRGRRWWSLGIIPLGSAIVQCGFATHAVWPSPLAHPLTARRSNNCGLQGFKTTATKDDLTSLEDRVNTRFDGIDSRLDRIEHLLMEEQKRKIEHLETRMKKLEDALAI
jgi:hypothetical protein